MMLKLKSILTEILLKEALPISLAKQYTSIERNPAMKVALDSIFSNLTKLPNAKTSKRGDRVYFPFSSDGGIQTTQSPIQKDIEQSLQGTEYSLKDYSLGVAIDKHGREVKLGKVLTKLGKAELVNKFNGDRQRESAKKTDFIMVFSKHPYDVAGMSTDRGWTSCMDVYDGSNSQYVSQDVKEGSFICYLAKPEDTNLNRPAARVLVKPFTNIKDANEVLYSAEDKIYGTAPSNFSKTVKDVLDDIQDGYVGKFTLVNSLYCDSGNRTITKYPKNIQSILDGKTRATTKEEVEEILMSFDIENYNINDDLTVDVNGNVDLSDKRLTRIPITFGKVNGSFNCVLNNLATLEGSPKEVGGSFNCFENNLTSLKGAPKEVGGGFDCFENNLTSLKGAPKEVGGDFNCSDNNLKSLNGAPNKVGGDFYCHFNNLTSLKGAPKEVGGSFNCSYNKLTSLEGTPKEVGGDFNCFENNLTSLEGAPKEVGGGFYCNSNNLTTLKGAPKEVGGNFDCFYNKLTSLEGSPNKVGGSFYCYNNNLTTLKGAPNKVGGYFDCSYNKLTTLEGAPKEVGGNFDCSKNNLTSLKGAPEKVGMDFSCRYNNPPLPQSEKDWAKENIKAKKFAF